MSFFGQCTTSYTEYGPFIQLFLLCIESLESHSVRVEREENMWFPENFYGSVRLQGIQNSYIGHVATSCGSQTAIQSYFE